MFSPRAERGESCRPGQLEGPGYQLAGRYVPNLHRPILAGCHYPTSVRAELGVIDDAFMKPRLDQFRALLQSRAQAQPMGFRSLRFVLFLLERLGKPRQRSHEIAFSH
jgi:hypothetical protein